MQPPENVTIGDLLYGRKPFVIEKYQRDYAWEDDEIDDFISDIQRLLRTYDSQPEPQAMRHFFGGLVSVLKGAPGTITGQVYEVVDGQQRLATFMISINLVSCALKKIAEVANTNGDTLNKAVAERKFIDIDDNYIFYSGRDVGERNSKMRLQLSPPDLIYFKDLIRNDNPPILRESHKRLDRANKKLQEKLINPICENVDVSLTQKNKELEKLFSCLTDNCHVIHIVSTNKKDAYRLFTVLNDRGKTLSDGDLLRAYTLDLLEGNSTLQMQLESYWNDILSGEKDGIELFFRNYYPSHLGHRALKRDLFGQYQNDFFNNKENPISAEDAEAIEQIVRNIFLENKIHKKLVLGVWPYENARVNLWHEKRLQRLVIVLKIDIVLPLLLSAASCLTEEQFSKIVNILEIFMFRFKNICGAHPGVVTYKLNVHAKEIRDDPQSYNIENLRTDLQSLLSMKAKDDTFKLNLIEKMTYSKTSSSHNEKIKHFITTLEAYLNWYEGGANGTPIADTSLTYDLDEISIDHIYPQNPAVNEKIPELEPIKHDLGNLTILTPNDNREIGNAKFSIKKSDCYAQSNVKINRILSQKEDWTKPIMELHREEIIKIALKVFVV